jgi:hypothetical protein
MKMTVIEVVMKKWKGINSIAGCNCEASSAGSTVVGYHSITEKPLVLEWEGHCRVHSNESY